jgi:hypothetical protein
LLLFLEKEEYNQLNELAWRASEKMPKLPKTEMANFAGLLKDLWMADDT